MICAPNLTQRDHHRAYKGENSLNFDFHSSVSLFLFVLQCKEHAAEAFFAECVLQKSVYECDSDQGPAEMVSCTVPLFSCHPGQQLQ